MDAAELVGLAVFGLAAGVSSGLLGIGGGIVFVPALAIFLHLSQLEAEATSLLAVVPVALVGAWRQHRYGNVRWREALVIGLASLAGVAGGIAIAASLPDDVLRKLFAALLLVVAGQLAWSAR